MGPTASGKTAFAVSVARSIGGEIVNADSRQVYRSMDIGTAKPTPQEQAAARHHLLDLVNPDQPFSLAAFLDAARAAIDDIHARGRVPLLVGGTGQYVWGLLEGWRTPRVPPDPALRRHLEARARLEGPDSLYEQLRRRDPEAAARIHPHNVRRVIRALEVMDRTGRPFSGQQEREPPPYRSLVIGLGLPREELYRRIDRRVDRMLEEGWLDEVRWLLDQGYTPDLAALSSLGYRELMSYMRGEYTLAEAVQRVKHATHRFARSQLTWFRRHDPRIRWVDARQGAGIQARALLVDFLDGLHPVLQ